MLSDTVGEQITLWRKERGWSREQLSEACQTLGAKLTLESIANIESGRRNKDGVRRRIITVDELAVFALALNVPLTALLIPYPDSEQVELAPAVNVSTVDAVDWFDGEVMFAVQEGFLKPSSDRDETWWSARGPVTLLRALRDTYSDWLQLARALADLEQKVHARDAVVSSARAELLRAEASVAAATDAERLKLLIASERDAYAAVAAARAAAEEARAAHHEAGIELRRLELVTLRTREMLAQLGYPVPKLPDGLSHLADRKSSEYDGGHWEQQMAGLPKPSGPPWPRFTPYKADSEE